MALPALFPALSSLGTLAPTGGAGGAAGPSKVDGVTSITPAFDTSNWTVATGSAKANGGAIALPWMLIVGAALVGLVLWKKL